MAIKLTGVRSLQNKLERMAFELSYDRMRVLSEHPNDAVIADWLNLLVRDLKKAAKTCTTA